MPTPPLRIRSDLVFTRQETRAGVVYVLKDPATRQFFRFREVEHFIIEQLDGTRDRDTILTNVEERFGAELPRETFLHFVDELHRYGLLAASRSRSRAPSSRMSRPR